MTRKIVLLVIFGVVLTAGAAGAWSNPGHQIVCEIAFQRLTPEAKALIRDLRRVDSDPGSSFSQSCLWPDKVRATTHPDTAEYHFLNTVRGEPAIDFAKDCAAHDCVVDAVERYAIYLMQPGNSERDRKKKADALKFLGHFVGDLHQPLHEGYGADRGGNLLDVRWFGESTNLHKVWDLLIGSRGGLRFPASALSLNEAVTEDQAHQWETLDVLGWSQETYRHAADEAYKRPEGGGFVDVEEGDALGDAYFDRALPVVKEQLQKAGVRLAFLLNSIAAGQELRFPAHCGNGG